VGGYLCSDAVVKWNVLLGLKDQAGADS